MRFANALKESKASISIKHFVKQPEYQTNRLSYHFSSMRVLLHGCVQPTPLSWGPDPGVMALIFGVSDS